MLVFLIQSFTDPDLFACWWSHEALLILDDNGGLSGTIPSQICDITEQIVLSVEGTNLVDTCWQLHSDSSTICLGVVGPYTVGDGFTIKKDSLETTTPAKRVDRLCTQFGVESPTVQPRTWRIWHVMHLSATTGMATAKKESSLVLFGLMEAI